MVFRSRFWSWSVFAVVAVSFDLSVSFADDWTEWRGSKGDGLVGETGFPIEWSADKNILWQTELPAPGNSSPIVYGDRLFLTCAIDDGKERLLISFDRSSGRILWKRSKTYTQDDPTHATNPWCAATPATDGERVFVWNGSAGATAYDFEGNELWHRDFGVFIHQWGHASSPRIYKDLVIYFGSPGPRVILTALNKITGKTVWERLLDNVTSPPEELYGSFATPFVWQNGSRAELLLPLPGYLASFHPETGEELWRCDGLGDLTYSDAIVGDDVILAFSGFRGPAIGLRPPGPKETGNLTESHRLWINSTAVQRVGTGVIVGDHFYLCGRKGEIQCGSIYTGEVVWTHKLRQQAWSSICLADGRLYLTDQESVTHILNPGNNFELLRQNAMRPKERSNSTLVFSNGQLFLRTYDRLYAIATVPE
ncbi:MAG: PQQ-binding-like beta-propeller repeat protein [Verrucomicrobia bacterium]|nr:PQQ-binding-like beta-propeller repeat protein [Verrucomicrobiota bacterium]